MAKRQKSLILPILLDFFKMVYQLAEEGKIVDEGDITELTAGGVFHRRGVLYAGNHSISGLTTPENFLSMILLTSGELEAVKHMGHLRILSLWADSTDIILIPFGMIWKEKSWHYRK